jgi:hypothetical protein
MDCVHMTQETDQWRALVGLHTRPVSKIRGIEAVRRCYAEGGGEVNVVMA